MYNRYQGNTGHMVRVDDRGHPHPSPPVPQRSQPPAGGQHGCPARPGQGPQRQPGLIEQLGRLIPNNLGELETEDVILLLILYLMYRESGDSELLMIMGGMFLL